MRMYRDSRGSGARNPYTVCPRCGGSGKSPEFALGLGNGNLVPSYVQMPCKRCHGEGRIFKGSKSNKGKQVETVITNDCPKYMLKDSLFLEDWLERLAKWWKTI